MERKTLFLLSTVLLLGHSALAADVKIDVSANRSSLYLGEPLILTVKVSGTDSPPQPDLSAITNASVKLLGSHSDSHYSIMIVNGKVTKESFSGRIFTYEVRPAQAGRLVAGPVTLTVDGAVLTQPGPVIEVVGVAKQEWAIVNISASRDAVLVDEPFDITLSLALKRLKAPYADVDPLDPGDPPSLSAPFLNDAPIDGLQTPRMVELLQPRLVTGRDAPGFTINDYAAPRDMFDMDSFFGQKRAKFLLPKRAIDTDGRPSFEYTITLTYVPRQEGSYTFGPAEFKGKMVIDADTEGRAVGKTIFAVGPACTVRVVPPPEEGRPPSYIGALGTNLQAEASLDTQTCNVGDPLTLTLSVSGPVRMENVFPPQLSLQPALGRSFRINDDTVETITRDSRKDFIYTVRPTQPGTYEFPAIETAYYDTAKRCYQTVRTQPIPIRANETSSVQGSNIIYTATNRTSRNDAKAEADRRVVGPLNVDPTGPIPCPLGPRPWHLALLILGPILYSLLRIGHYAVLHMPRLAEATTRRRAAGRATSLLQQAKQLAATDALGAHRALCDALKGYLGERFSVSSAGLTPADARRLLIEKTGDKALAEAFGGILERSFNATFTTAAANGAAADHDSQDAAHVIQAIEVALRSAIKEGRP